MINTQSVLRSTLLILTLLSNPAFAHSPLISSSPKNGQSLQTAPTALSLGFKKPVKLVQIHLLSTATDEKFRPNFVSEQLQHTAPLPALVSGEYVAHWRAMSEDGHLMIGKIVFTVSP